jgi:Xaa-Pro aminopeptidase
MASDLLHERVIAPISTEELERRWKLVREVMKENKIDFLLAQNGSDYLGGYVKWFTDLPAVHDYTASIIFPVDDEMTTIWHGSSDPAKAGPGAWLLRGVKKRLSTPILPSLNFTTSFDGQLVVQELKGYKNLRLSFVNEGRISTGFTKYIREHLTSATFVDITEEIDLFKAVKSPEEIERIKYSAYLHDEAMKACAEAMKPGVREFEVTAWGRYKCRMLGSEQQFIHIGSSPQGNPVRYSSIHAQNRMLQDGDQIVILIEANDPAGYYTHLHRHFCIGSARDETLEHHELAKEAQKFTLDLIKPGADPMEILNANNEWMVSRGYEPETRLYAHGQGYDLVERPSFQVGESMKIRAGMNVAAHPTVSSKLGTVKLCDNYIVTETGLTECLHKFPQEITVV